MSRTVHASLVLAAVVASTLAAPVAGYKLTLTEAGGNVLTGVGQVNETSITVENVPPGTYAASIVAVDATGAALTPPVAAAEPLVVTDEPAVVTVNVPTALALTLA